MQQSGGILPDWRPDCIREHRETSRPTSSGPAACYYGYLGSAHWTAACWADQTGTRNSAATLRISRIARLKLFDGSPVFLHQRNSRLADFCNVSVIIDTTTLPRDAALPRRDDEDETSRTGPYRTFRPDPASTAGMVLFLS
jgi:hypothetical protein